MVYRILRKRRSPSPTDFGDTRVGRYLQRRFLPEPGGTRLRRMAAGPAIYLFALSNRHSADPRCLGLPAARHRRRGSSPCSPSQYRQHPVFGLRILGGHPAFRVLAASSEPLFPDVAGRSIMARITVRSRRANSVRRRSLSRHAARGLIGVSAAGIDLSSLRVVAGALLAYGIRSLRPPNIVSNFRLRAHPSWLNGRSIATGSPPGTTEGFVRRHLGARDRNRTFQRQSNIVAELRNSSTLPSQLGHTATASVARRYPGRVSYDSDPRQSCVLEEIGQTHDGVLRNPTLRHFRASGVVISISVFASSSAMFEFPRLKKRTST